MANPSKMDTKIVHSDSLMSEQAQLASTSYNKALSSLSEIFGIERSNPFKFKGKEIPMTDENIGMMLKLLLEESNRREKLKEEVEKKKKEDEEKARKQKIEKEKLIKEEEEWKKKREDEEKEKERERNRRERRNLLANSRN
uniref:Uncharacterized protein n=1 Tax=Cucumis melo TaxID=3656 RepID=A0A9I9DJW7_CUCME